MGVSAGTSRRPRQPFAALADLCEDFFADLSFVDSCALLRADELPSGARELLAHREHMTSALEARCGAPVELRVLKEVQDMHRYSRAILLHPRGAPQRAVEFGVARIELRQLSDAVRDEVLARRAPLGDILIRHEVLRRVSPRWFFRFPAGSPIATRLGEGDAYGRVGVIYCDEEPAIELLEVVAADAGRPKEGA
jgi:chorismate-pyruvate lyase